MSTQIKEPNPKDIVGGKKASLSGLAWQVIFEVGLAMMEGARKYGKHNWRAAPVVGSVYFDAVLRHICDWWEGQDIDPASGVSHLSKAMADLMILRDAQIQGTLIDDRPPSKFEGANMDALNVQATAIVERFPDPKDPFTRVPLPGSPAEALPQWIQTLRPRFRIASGRRATSRPGPRTMPGLAQRRRRTFPSIPAMPQLSA